jgi:hypothetical protein
MTFELAAVHGIRCTLVDPRPLKLNKQQHKHLARAGTTALLRSWSAQQLQQGCLTVKELPLQQQKQQQQLEQQPEQHKQQQGIEELSQPNQQHAEQQQYQQEKQQQQQQQQQLHLHQVQGWFGPELWRSSGWQQLFGSSSSSGFSLVIGLHPDEATEPIADYALEAGLPFAVVPCCVFPRLFPERRLAVDGGQAVAVESYGQLVQYLMQKGGAGREVLGFVGANVVVFRRAPAA